MAPVDHTSPHAESIYRTLISGCHILHNHGILDAYGHLSVRHPSNKDIFLLPRNLAPALVSSKADIVEYRVEDASPVDPSSPDGYAERFIHSEIYKRYPEVQSVVHSHAKAVLPYTITEVDLQPCVHMSGFLGNAAPKFDIAKYYQDGDVQDLLVRSERLGKELSLYFSSDKTSLDHPVVLMRGHGLTVVGASIHESVFRAIYTTENADIQTTAITLQATVRGGTTDGVNYLHNSELAGTTRMTQWSSMRPWNLWVREVESSTLYANLE